MRAHHLDLGAGVFHSSRRSFGGGGKVYSNQGVSDLLTSKNNSCRKLSSPDAHKKERIRDKKRGRANRHTLQHEQSIDAELIPVDLQEEDRYLAV